MRASLGESIPGELTLPLSHAQRRLWFLDQLFPGVPWYNITTALRLRGDLDARVLRLALLEVVARHEVLRTGFPAPHGEPVQRVDPVPRIAFELTDLTTADTADREALALGRAARQAHHPFDLDAGPLLRGELVRLHPSDHLLVLALHHIVCDGWSLGLLYRELSLIYSARLLGQPCPLPPLPAQYSDYSAWQLQHLAGARLRQHLDWWRQQLADAPMQLGLPLDHPRPSNPAFTGGAHDFTIPGQLWRQVCETARRHRASAFMVLLAAYAVLLSRVTGQLDLIVGFPVHGRGRTEFEPLIGFFVNTLPLRLSLVGRPDITELIRRTRAAALAAQDHQELPFDALVEHIRPARSSGQNPLVQTLFSLEQDPGPPPSMPGLDAELVDVPHGVAKFDLSLAVTERAGGADGQRGTLAYRSDLFEPASITRLADGYLRLLAAAMTAPEEPVEGLPLLGARQERRLLAQWSSPGRASGPGEVLHELIVRQAAATPGRMAIRSPDGQLSYAALHARASQLALQLRLHGARPDQVIGVCLPRGTDLPVCLLAVLLSDAAYLPLDPDLPPARQAALLSQAGVGLVLTTTTLAPLLPPHMPVIRLDQLHLAGRPAADMGVRARPGNLAYVIYTSGSTGTPKPVAVSHRAIANLAAAARDRYRIGPNDRVLQFASPGFDMVAEELYGTWLAGGCVVPLADASMPEHAFERFLAEQEVTVLNLPASYWWQWSEDLITSGRRLPGSVRLLVVGSEQVDADALRRWLRHTGLPTLNAYGVTEATVTATVHDTAGGVGVSVPIGRPIAGVEAFVVDRELRPVPVGVAGELCLGGVGLARGYLGRPDLTAERFVPHPFRAGERVYRTGDVARWLDGGVLEFRGRLDDQVKVRGHRIEPGEIEAVLMAHPAVGRVVVTGYRARPGDWRLAAYLVPERPGDLDTSELRGYLATRLPAHLVPSAFVQLDRLPVTPAGKLDRRALPVPDARQWQADKPRVPPRTDLEDALARVWRRVLHAEQVGVDDNFFDLGGHSLLLAKVRAAIAKDLGRDLPMAALYEHPTIAALARQLAGAGPEAAEPYAADGADDRQQGLGRLMTRRTLLRAPADGWERR